MVTLVTLAAIPLASGKLAKALMAGSNTVPFCSSLTLSAVGVLASKNFSQFAVICATAAEPEAALEAVAEADVEAGALEDEVVAGELELLQAAIVAASARPRAGAAIRRARKWDRMTRLLSLGRTNWGNAAIPGSADVLAQSAPYVSRGAAGYPFMTDVRVRVAASIA